jgi:hypothetical protein
LSRRGHGMENAVKGAAELRCDHVGVRGKSLFTRFIPPRKPARGVAWRLSRTMGACDQDMIGLVPDLMKFVPSAKMFTACLFSLDRKRSACVASRRNLDTLVMTGGETNVCALATLGAIDWASPSFLSWKPVQLGGRNARHDDEHLSEPLRRAGRDGNDRHPRQKLPGSAWRARASGCLSARRVLWAFANYRFFINPGLSDAASVEIPSWNSAARLNV